MSLRAMLGPQRPTPNLAPLLEHIGLSGGKLCVVTAGWQEREGELQDLEQHVARAATDLRLYERAEDVFARDADYRDAYRERQATLAEMQRLYGRRIRHAIRALRELLSERKASAPVLSARRMAMRSLRTIDRQHARQIGTAHRDFERDWPATARPAIVAHQREVRAELDSCEGVLIAGGHVHVLLNRLRLFGLGELLASRPVIAWSAGAMAISERIVLFHDSPPQGAGHAELSEIGLALIPGIIPLPHATARLRLDDSRRVSVFARRFGPSRCATLDPGDMLVWSADRLAYAHGSRRLLTSGALEAMTPS